MSDNDAFDKFCSLLDNLHVKYCYGNSLSTLKDASIKTCQEKEFPLNENLVREESIKKSKKELKKIANANKQPRVTFQNDICVVAKNSSQILKLNDIADSISSDSKNTDIGQKNKSKAELKRERREKQEAERAVKQDSKEKKKKENSQTTVTQVIKEKKKSEVSSLAKEVVSKGKIAKSTNEREMKVIKRKIPLLAHLMLSSAVVVSTYEDDGIHPAMHSLGLRMKAHAIDGCNARVISTLQVIKRIISDYQTPPSCDLGRDLVEKLNINLSFLNGCRTIPPPLENALRFVKREANSIDANMPEIQAKEQLLSSIDEYVGNNIKLASDTITSHAVTLMESGDIILTYGFSSLVQMIIISAIQSGKSISVVVADSPGEPTGRLLVSNLLKKGIPTYYRLLNDLSGVITKVTKCLFEAEAVLLNGAVFGPCGLAGVSSISYYHSIPIIIVSHTFKFCNIDQTDSLVINELGDESNIAENPLMPSAILKNWNEMSNLNVINLTYDVTPSSFITALVTEQSVLPTSAVPVIIKRNYASLGQD